jgi:MoxR-like ATPase
MQKLIDSLVAEINTVLLGKEQQVRLAVCCLLARGHLLIEDLPGMGKTTLAHALSKVLGLDYTRLQFTSDMLPADIIGSAIYEQKSGAFQFMPGPVFTQVLLADEINRATPRAQSALLEAMEEGQVSVDGQSRRLPAPFFVIATQNPVSQSGTYPLPESQLDRFLMRLSLGYPDREAERQLFLGDDSRLRLPALRAVVSAAELEQLQAAVNDVHCSDSLLDYLQRLVEATRTSEQYAWGLSPRGALALLRCAKAWALMQGRGHVVPEDLQQVFPAVVEHRLALHTALGGSDVSPCQALLRSVAVVA